MSEMAGCYQGEQKSFHCCHESRNLLVMNGKWKTETNAAS